MTRVKTEEELSDALKRGDSTIEIEGSLAKKVIKIKATGGVAWLIAFGAIGIAVYAAMVALPAAPVTGGSSAAVGFVATSTGASAAVTILGAGVAISAIAMAVRARGTQVLSDLRSKYKIEKSSSDEVVLRRI